MVVPCVKNHYGRTYFDEFMPTCLRGAVFLDTVYIAGIRRNVNTVTSWTIITCCCAQFIYLFIHDGRTMWPLTPSVIITCTETQSQRIKNKRKHYMKNQIKMLLWTVNNATVSRGNSHLITLWTIQVFNSYKYVINCHIVIKLSQ